MLKRFLICSFLSIIYFTALSQLDTAWVKKNISSCADSMTDAFKVRNWDKYTRYTNPSLIATMGGVENFKNMVSSGFGAIPDNAWEKYEHGNILQIVKTPADIQTTIELNSILNIGSMLIKSTVCLVGQSWDGGQFWTFFSSDGDKAVALQIKPDLSDRLIIPGKVEIKEPINQIKN